jgi:hypothetical protein
VLRWAKRGGLHIDRPGTQSIDQVLHISTRFTSLPFDLADASI